MAILGNTTINGSLNINGVPVEPGAGTLKTNNSSPLPVTTESLGGTVNLHKISKTGRYTDLIGSAEAVVATTQHVHFSSTIDNNNFTLSEGGLYNIFLNEGVSSNVYNPTALGTRYLLLAQNDPAQNGLFERIGFSGNDYLFTRVTNQPVVIIREGHNKFRIYKMNDNGVWEGGSTGGSLEILQVTCPTAAATSAKEVVDASRVPVAGDIVIVTFTNGNSVSNPTLNINYSGAMNIRLGTTNASTTTMTVGAGGVVPLYFDGTYYNMFGSYRTSDSNTYDRMYHNVAKQMGETLYRYKLILEGVDGKYYPLVTTNQTNATVVQKTPTNATLKIGGNILYYNATATVATNSVVTNTYSEINMTTLVYNFNQTDGYAVRPIYLVGIPQADGGFKLDNSSPTSYYTQNLPTTEDGKIYIYLGITYAQNSLRLEIENPVYEFKEEKIRPYIPEHTHDIATKTEAENGTNNTKIMTPLRVKQAIDKKLASNVTIGGNLDVSGVTYFDDEVYFSGMVGNSQGLQGIFGTNSYTIQVLTQAQYNAIGTKDSNRIYIIVG